MKIKQGLLKQLGCLYSNPLACWLSQWLQPQQCQNKSLGRHLDRQRHTKVPPARGGVKLSFQHQFGSSYLWQHLNYVTLTMHQCLHVPTYTKADPFLILLLSDSFYNQPVHWVLICWQSCILLHPTNKHSSINLSFGKDHSDSQSCLQSSLWNLCRKCKVSVLNRYITQAENSTLPGNSAFLLKAAQHGKPRHFILPAERQIIILNT